MSEPDTRLFVARDRTWHPAALTPDYKTSVARSPRQAQDLRSPVATSGADQHPRIAVRNHRPGFLAPEARRA